MKKFNLIFLFFILFGELSSQSFLETSGEIAFSFYHNIMSPLKSSVSKCQFEPSCSHFSDQAIKKYGFLSGILMTSDRLMRCSGGNLQNSLYSPVGELLLDNPESNFIFGEGQQEFKILDNNSSLENKDSIDENFKLAKFLFEKNEYDLSALELYRIKINTQEASIIKKTEQLLAINCLMKKDINCAYNHLDNLTSNNDDDLDNLILKFIVNDINGALITNENLLKHSLTNEIDEVLLKNKLLFYVYIKSEELENAGNLIADIKVFLQKQRDTLSYSIVEFKNLSYKSPLFSGILSALIPGSGYIYSGEVKEGLSALLINGLLGWGIYSLFTHDNIGSGILASMIATPFYLGNIVGSANAAHLSNENQREKYYSNLRKRLNIDFYFSIEYFNSFWNK